MPTATKICKVCGKEYEYCHTFRSVANMFRWQDVACSPSCGAIYLAEIQKSRGIIPKDENEAAKNADVVEEEFDVDEEDDFDEDEEEDDDAE